MDAQDFRSLQEAYMEVVMREGKVPWNDPKSPLESGHTPAEKNRAKRERTGVEDLSKSPTDKQYARYGDMKSADDEQSSASKRKDKPTHKFRDLPIRTDKGKKQTLGQMRRTRGTPKPGASDEKSNLYQSPIRKDDKRTRGGKTDQWKGPNPRNEEAYMEVVEGREGGRFEYNQRHGRPLITPEISQRASEKETLGGGTYERGPKRLPKSKRKYDRQVLSGVRAASDQEKQRARKRMGIKEDIYDIILSHLLDEGYAETIESAEAIMVNMSEEWRESILG